MTRSARIVVPGVAHHVTQRGVRRQDVFFSDEDRSYYLHWLGKISKELDVQILAYCLMANHVHHVLVPPTPTSLAKLFKPLHIRFACYINKRYSWVGHLWQQRFYSAPLDNDYLFTAIRYVERNPVTAGVVKHASEYQWSSSAAHCGKHYDSALTNDPDWQSRLAKIDDWYLWLTEEENPLKVNNLRVRTSKDLPCGTQSFLNELECTSGRSLIMRSRGRPKKKNK